MSIDDKIIDDNGLEVKKMGIYESPRYDSKSKSLTFWDVISNSSIFGAIAGEIGTMIYVIQHSEDFGFLISCGYFAGGTAAGAFLGFVVGSIVYPFIRKNKN